MGERVTPEPYSLVGPEHELMPAARGQVNTAKYGQREPRAEAPSPRKAWLPLLEKGSVGQQTPWISLRNFKDEEPII